MVKGRQFVLSPACFYMPSIISWSLMFLDHHCHWWSVSFFDIYLSSGIALVLCCPALVVGCYLAFVEYRIIADHADPSCASDLRPPSWPITHLARSRAESWFILVKKVELPTVEMVSTASVTCGCHAEWDPPAGLRLKSCRRLSTARNRQVPTGQTYPWLICLLITAIDTPFK